jgi:hypothetical protein
LLKKFDTICFYPIFALPIKKGIGELVAQLVEQYTFNVWALGSSPSQFTRPQHKLRSFFIVVLKLYSHQTTASDITIIYSAQYFKTFIAV